jgi:hypothetical protein
MFSMGWWRDWMLKPSCKPNSQKRHVYTLKNKVCIFNTPSVTKFTHLKACFFTQLKVCILLVAKFTHLKACFSKRCVFLHTIWCVFCPESLANKVHTLSRAFLHTLQGVQNNTPFCLLHSLQITPWKVCKITHLCSAWSQITDLIGIKNK